LSIHKRGSGYVVRYRDLHNKHRSKTFPTRKLAQKYETQVKLKKYSGTLINYDHGNKTLENVFIEWSTPRLTPSIKWKTEFNSLWKSHIEPHFWF
jgi:hypothetical protein